jgi:FkbM family methyltransferase
LRLDHDPVNNGAGLPEFSVLVRTLNRVGRVARRYAVTGRFRAAPSPIIERFFGGKDCFFVQVGSNDGVCADPLHHLIKANPRWRGIFIEPQADCFAALVANYGRERDFAFEQIAVADTDGVLPFYSLSPEGFRDTGIPASFSVFGSLNRDYVIEAIGDAMRTYNAKVAKPAAEYVLETPVRCEPLMSVLERHHVDRIDVFQVDAEGSDYKIIRQIDFARFRPKLILYEHCALGADDVVAAEELLASNGYSLINCGPVDTMAVRRGP